MRFLKVMTTSSHRAPIRCACKALPIGVARVKVAQHSQAARYCGDQLIACVLVCKAAGGASTYQQFSAFLFDDVCLPPDMSQVLLHHVLVLAMHLQAEGMSILAGCAVCVDDSGSALADIMSPEHSYAHVGVCQGFIVCQRKDWLCRILRLAD